MTAPTETPSRMTDADVARLLLSQATLTTKQAGSLASRWAWWEAKKVECPDTWMLISAGPAPLLDPEVEQLVAWVRARLAELIDESGAWQERHTATMRNWLAMRVGIDLGADEAADALCEAAGWPS